MDEALAITGNDPVMRGVGGPNRGPAWRTADGTVVAFTGLDAHDRVQVLVAVGPADRTADLVLAVRDELPHDIRLILPRDTPLVLDGPAEWHFRATYDAPPPQPAERAVEWHEDDEAVTELLRLAAPDSSSWPGDGRTRRWAVIREEDRLVACLGDTSSVSGVGHVSSIAVREDARGRGLGSSITAWAARRMFEEGCDVITLGVYSDNHVGRRMYDGLGFTVNRALTSGTLADARRPATL